MASIIQSDEWAHRHVRRAGWARAHRAHLIVAVVALDCTMIVALALAFGFAPIELVMLSGPLGPVIGWALLRDDQPAYQVATWRESAFHSNGLRFDGSLDPAPDRWTTLAALPAWVVAIVGVLEVAAVGTFFAGLLWVFGLAIAHV